MINLPSGIYWSDLWAIFQLFAGFLLLGCHQCRYLIAYLELLFVIRTMAVFIFLLQGYRYVWIRPGMPTPNPGPIHGAVAGAMPGTWPLTGFVLRSTDNYEVPSVSNELIDTTKPASYRIEDDPDFHSNFTSIEAAMQAYYESTNLSHKLALQKAWYELNAKLPISISQMKIDIEEAQLEAAKLLISAAMRRKAAEADEQSGYLESASVHRLAANNKIKLSRKYRKFAFSCQKWIKRARSYQSKILQFLQAEKILIREDTDSSGYDT